MDRNVTLTRAHVFNKAVDTNVHREDIVCADKFARKMYQIRKRFVKRVLD